MIKKRALAVKKNRAQHCRMYWLAACVALGSPFMVQAQAPVVDDSDNFVMMEDQAAYESPANRKYAYHTEESSSWRLNNQDEETPLAMDDGNREPIDSDQTLADKVQSLQKEIQELRGQLEVQAHELKQLKDQQLTFYKDLDARLATAGNPKAPALTGKSPVVPPPISSAPAAPNKAVAPVMPDKIVAQPSVLLEKIASAPTGIPGKRGTYIQTSDSGAEEKNKYEAAYLLVKNKRHQEALGAMQAFLVQYPHGAYTANAHYWLGELYMVKNNYPRAIEQFVVVLDQFPKSDKLAASTLKLGYALAATGRTLEARQRLQQVINRYPGTPVAQLASEKLYTL